MSPRLLPIACFALLLGLGGCTGYRLGGAKPSHLAAVSSVHVALVQNETQIPRATAQATNSLIDALTRDGTFDLATVEQADARLETTFREIDYRQARATRIDSLRSEELEMVVTLNWILVDAENPGNILDAGESKGSTRFFVDPNLQTARQTALIDALKRASDAVVARIANGF